MKQYEAVIEIMKINGGFATLGWLYQNALKVEGVKWGTKTPFATIRRIVQNDKLFFKIRPGLWALKEYKDKIPFAIASKKTAPENQEFNHTYYQGLLVEIGNLKGFKTAVPNQDKNKLFLSNPLSNIITVDSFYRFTYENIVQRARTIDVVWFNERQLPDSTFEVEHSTDIQNSLLKFMELQDFIINFKIVADEMRRSEFQKKLAYSAFSKIKKSVKFISYQMVSDMHTKTCELKVIENNW